MFEKCEKCYGRGFIPYFRHVADGICFDCEGRGAIEIEYRNAWGEPVPAQVPGLTASGKPAPGRTVRDWFAAIDQARAWGDNRNPWAG
jgi:hypothetical protein